MYVKWIPVDRDKLHVSNYRMVCFDQISDVIVILVNMTSPIQVYQAFPEQQQTHLAVICHLTVPRLEVGTICQCMHIVERGS